VLCFLLEVRYPMTDTRLLENNVLKDFKEIEII
jgi:hypothetical protein